MSTMAVAVDAFRALDMSRFQSPLSEFRSEVLRNVTYDRVPDAALQLSIIGRNETNQVNAIDLGKVKLADLPDSKHITREAIGDVASQDARLLNVLDKRLRKVALLQHRNQYGPVFVRGAANFLDNGQLGDLRSLNRALKSGRSNTLTPTSNFFGGNDIKQLAPEHLGPQQERSHW